MRDWRNEIGASFEEALEDVKRNRVVDVDDDPKNPFGEPPPCIWTEDEVDGFWATACGEAFVTTTEEPPSAHKMKWCPFCGQRIEERHERE